MEKCWNWMTPILTPRSHLSIMFSLISMPLGVVTASASPPSGYPTLKIYMHGVPTEYYGPRKDDLLVRHLSKFFAPDVVLNSDSAVKEFVEEARDDFPIFIGFGLDESQISNLAIKYNKKAWFSVAKDFSEDIMTNYDFDKVPALVATHPEYNEQVFMDHLKKTDTLVADALWETIHVEVQDFVQYTLAMMLRTTFNKKKDLSRLSFFYPRLVAPTAAQIRAISLLN